MKVQHTFANKIEIDFDTVPFTDKEKTKLETILIKLTSKYYKRAEKRKKKNESTKRIL